MNGQQNKNSNGQYTQLVEKLLDNPEYLNLMLYGNTALTKEYYAQLTHMQAVAGGELDTCTQSLPDAS
jgi:hypothetical protein